MVHRRQAGPYIEQEMQTASTPGEVDLAKEDIPSLDTCKHVYTKRRQNVTHIMESMEHHHLPTDCWSSYKQLCKQIKTSSEDLQTHTYIGWLLSSVGNDPETLAR